MSHSWGHLNSHAGTFFSFLPDITENSTFCLYQRVYKTILLWHIICGKWLIVLEIHLVFLIFSNTFLSFVGSPSECFTMILALHIGKLFSSITRVLSWTAMIISAIREGPFVLYQTHNKLNASHETTLSPRMESNSASKAARAAMIEWGRYDVGCGGNLCVYVVVVVTMIEKPESGPYSVWRRSKQDIAH